MHSRVQSRSLIHRTRSLSARSSIARFLSCFSLPCPTPLGTFNMSRAAFQHLKSAAGSSGSYASPAGGFGSGPAAGLGGAGPVIINIRRAPPLCLSPRFAPGLFPIAVCQPGARVIINQTSGAPCLPPSWKAGRLTACSQPVEGEPCPGQPLRVLAGQRTQALAAHSQCHSHPLHAA